MSFNVGPRVVSATGGSIKRVGNYRVHTFPSELVTDGLVLNLDAGDPRSYPGSGTTWTDLSGNGNNGTFGASTAAPTYNNANGGSLVFDGTNDYIIKSTPSSLNFGSLDFSVFCWIKCTKRGGGFYGTAVALDVDGSGNGILFFVEGSSGIFRTWVAGQVLNGSIDVADNQWHQVGIVKFGTTATQFVDGIQRSSFACGSSLISSPNLILGNYTTTSIVAYAYNGNLSQVTIHSRALSAAEVAQNYDALKVRYTSYTNTFTPTCGGGSGKVEVLCVAGGGGGASGGGGAGGLLYNSAFTVSSNTSIGVTVGAGGTSGNCDVGNGSAAVSGQSSSFSSLSSVGGGNGGQAGGTQTGGNGGSGGGAAANGGGSNNGGTGTSGQGFNGGGNGGFTSSPSGVGGGGGSAGAAITATSARAFPGGNGLTFAISGTSSSYSGGGGGGAYSGSLNGSGGIGGGGNGASGGSVGTSAIPNTGSGGGGGSSGVLGGNGSNGIIIVRYPATDYNVELLVVGGGGAGGNNHAGGGGGGGLIYYSSYPVSAGTKYSVTVGAGGVASGTGANNNTNGGNSQFGTLVSIGGGAGGNRNDQAGTSPGQSGGSGGGGGGSQGQFPNNYAAGSGTNGQGNPGGVAVNVLGAGGGGAGAPGQSTATESGFGGTGGAGLQFSISGTPTGYAGGGSGSNGTNTTAANPLGGGGAGGAGAGSNGTAGTTNTGGGGGGGGAGNTTGSNGGSGIIIIAYQGPQRGVGGTVDTTSRPGYTLHTFTTTGTDFFIP